jgi:hypothetical protein
LEGLVVAELLWELYGALRLFTTCSEYQVSTDIENCTTSDTEK